MQKEKKRIKIGLALGGGAALGFAHIGVIKALEENNISIDCICGTSMGSVIGGLYSLGATTKQLSDAVDKFEFKSITKLNAFKMIKEGIYNTDKMGSFVESFLDQNLIENARIPYRCTAVDLKTGKLYVFKSGPVGEAVRASSAIPGVFAPVIKDDMFLVDGGVLNQVPFDETKKMGADFVLAVNVVPKYQPRDKVGLNRIDKVLMSAFGVMLNSREEYRKKTFDKSSGYYLDVESTYSEMDFSHKANLASLELGYKVATENMPKILRAINKVKKSFNKKVN